MAMSNAERQRIYRKSRRTAGDNGERQLNVWVTTHAAQSLTYLAKYHGVTKREMLERLISAEDARVTHGMSEAEIDRYVTE
jgi:hypothetical protein